MSRRKFKVLMPKVGAEVGRRELTLSVGGVKYTYDCLQPTATTFGMFEAAEGTEIKLTLQDHWSETVRKAPHFFSAVVTVKDPLAKQEPLGIVLSSEPKVGSLLEYPAQAVITKIEKVKPASKPVIAETKTVEKKEESKEVPAAESKSQEKRLAAQTEDSGSEEKPERAMPESAPPERTRKKKRKL